MYTHTLDPTTSNFIIKHMKKRFVIENLKYIDSVDNIYYYVLLEKHKDKRVFWTTHVAAGLGEKS